MSRQRRPTAANRARVLMIFARDPRALGRLPFFISLCGNPARARRRPSLRERAGHAASLKRQAVSSFRLSFSLFLCLLLPLLFLPPSLLSSTHSSYLAPLFPSGRRTSSRLTVLSFRVSVLFSRFFSRLYLPFRSDLSFYPKPSVTLFLRVSFFFFVHYSAVSLSLVLCHAILVAVRLLRDELHKAESRTALEK